MQMNKAKVLDQKIEPVKKSVLVSLSVSDAFELFTKRIANWWPLVTHSVGEEKAETCVLEGRKGGRLYEIQKDGTESVWGTILSWEPPKRLVFTWHPGRESETAQEVEIVFTPEDGGTRLDLIHRGWEILGEDAQKRRDNYDTGWDYVLGLYLTQTGKDPVKQ